ncbi:MAG: methylisocitrate lyase [Hyphomicrobiaceae bacterium]|jgi:methylisocitrate lyase
MRSPRATCYGRSMRDRIQSLLSPSSISLTTGVFDPLSAMIAERAGFEAVMLSGYSVAGSYLGKPDFGLLTQSEMIDVARRTVAATKMAVLVDGDTGGGGALNVMRLVEELASMGAAGVFLEDQKWPKRCGHMRDKVVVSAEEHAEKISAAKQARSDRPFVIVGRTDARAPLGLEEAIRRGNAYREAGADIVFIEAPQSIDELRTIRSEISGPLLANMVEGGKTPLLSASELAELGFEIVVFPVTGILAVARALETAFTRLRSDGTSAAVSDALMGFDEFGTLVGLNEAYTVDERFGRTR